MILKAIISQLDNYVKEAGADDDEEPTLKSLGVSEVDPSEVELVTS